MDSAPHSIIGLAPAYRIHTAYVSKACRKQAPPRRAGMHSQRDGYSVWVFRLNRDQVQIYQRTGVELNSVTGAWGGGSSCPPLLSLKCNPVSQCTFQTRLYNKCATPLRSKHYNILFGKTTHSVSCYVNRIRFRFVPHSVCIDKNYHFLI